MTSPLLKKHHIRRELCQSRKAYREGREQKAVKVYTVAQESKYLIVQGIPALGLHKDLMKEFLAFGAVEEYHLLDDYPTEEFTEVLWIKFVKMQSARLAKRKMDNLNYCGGVLHVFYAPEYESVDDTREKLQDRQRTVAWRLRVLATENNDQDIPASISTTETFQERDEKVQMQQVTDAAISPAVTELSSDKDVVPYTQPPLLPPPPTQQFHLPPSPFSLPQHLMLPPPPLPYPPLLTIPASSSNSPRPTGLPFYPPLPVNFKSSSANIFPDVFRHHPPVQRPRQPMRNLPQRSITQSQPSSDRAIKSTDWVSSKGEVPPNEDYLGSRVERLPRSQQFNKPIKSSMDPAEVVIKSYEHTGSVPRFVPRQLVKRPSETAAVQPPRPDPVNEELKKAALELGSVPQGPSLPPDEELQRKMFRSSATGDSSLDETVAIIRKKVSQVSSTAPPAKKFKES